MNSKFINMTLGEAKKLMGTKRRTALVRRRLRCSLRGIERAAVGMGPWVYFPGAVTTTTRSSLTLCSLSCVQNVAAKARHSAWDLEEMPTSALPAAFDVRTNFPWASNITSVVRDQSACGSCWAFGSTEAFVSRRKREMVGHRSCCVAPALQVAALRGWLKAM
jgi:hypothetical protein